jgi:guanylate kinase
LNTDKNNNNSKKGKIIVFSAASGAGKTTILDHLKKVMPDIVYSISATTRRPRAHEKHGVHYFFMSEDEFNRKIADDEFAEWAVVHDNHYGTPKSFINSTIQSGKHIIMDIDVYGKIKFDRAYPEAIGIFIKPPSRKELEGRLRKRKTDSEEIIKLRLFNAEKETEFAEKKGKYEYEIVNDELDRTEQEVVALVKKIINE